MQGQLRAAWQPPRSGLARASSLVALLLMAQVVAFRLRLRDKPQRKPCRGRLDSGPGQIGKHSYSAHGHRVQHPDRTKATTWTNVAGQYSLQVPASGRYVVKAQMAAFATITGKPSSTPPHGRKGWTSKSCCHPAPNAFRRIERNASGREGFGRRRAWATRASRCSTARAQGSRRVLARTRRVRSTPPGRRFSQYCDLVRFRFWKCHGFDFQSGLGGGFDDRRNDFSTGGTPGAPGTSAGTWRAWRPLRWRTAGGGGGFGGFGGGGFGGFPGGSFPDASTSTSLTVPSTTPLALPR